MSRKEHMLEVKLLKLDEFTPEEIELIRKWAIKNGYLYEIDGPFLKER